MGTSKGLTIKVGDMYMEHVMLDRFARLPVVSSYYIIDIIEAFHWSIDMDYQSFTAGDMTFSSRKIGV